LVFNIEKHVLLLMIFLRHFFLRIFPSAPQYLHTGLGL